MGRPAAKMIVPLLCCISLCMIPAGCGGTAQTLPADESPAVAPTEDAADMESMVVRLDDGSLLLIDRRTGSPFVPTAIDKADIVGPDGSRLTPDELRTGNVVRVSGNGIMLESYPGQYPGIDAIEVVAEGSEADADAYADLIAELSATADPSQPATADLEYATDLARVTLALRDNGYTWTYEEDGESVQVAADAAHPVQIVPEDLPDARIDGPIEASVVFDRAATALTVTRWDERAVERAASAAGSYQGVEADALAGESVDAALAGTEATFTMTPGYRYALDATFAEGAVGYVFVALD